MKVSSLQKLDRYFGVPICFGLTLLRKVFGRKTAVAPTVRSILFVKLAEQGSTVLAYPAIQRAVKMVGRENVYFICFDDNRFILDALGLVPEENVIPVAYSGIGTLAVSFCKALMQLRNLNLDAAIDMEFFARGSAALAFLSGCKIRVGFHAFFAAGPYRGDLMTHRLLYNPYLHTEQSFQMMVEALQCDPAQLPTLPQLPPEHTVALPQFSGAPEEVQQVREILIRATGCDAIPPLILLNPNASDLLPLRRWDSQRYVELARRLLLKFPEAYIGFTGAPGEASAIQEMAAEVDSKRCVSLAGKTTLRQLLILYSFAKVLVTNDSGPAHFAVLTPIEVVTLFGPETPKLFAARTPRNTSLWAGIACSPCVNAYNNRQTSCLNNRCMQMITVEQVFEEVCCAYKRHSVNEKSDGIKAVLA